MTRMYCIQNFVSTDFNKLLMYVHDLDIQGTLEIYSTETDAYFSKQTSDVSVNMDPRIQELCGKYVVPGNIIRVKREERSYSTVEFTSYGIALIKRYHLNKLISECEIAVKANVVLEFTHYGFGVVDKKKPFMSMRLEEIGSDINIQTYRFGSWPVGSFNRVTINSKTLISTFEQTRSEGKDSSSTNVQTKNYDHFMEQLVDYPHFDYVQFSTGTPLSMIGFGQCNHGK